MYSTAKITASYSLWNNNPLSINAHFGHLKAPLCPRELSYTTNYSKSTFSVILDNFHRVINSLLRNINYQNHSLEMWNHF